jgi:hypothetical protein
MMNAYHRTPYAAVAAVLILSANTLVIPEDALMMSGKRNHT